MKKKVLFFPGLGVMPLKQKKALLPYMDIAKIDWNKGTYDKNIKDYNILSGFSMGNILILDYALKHKVKKLILCSLVTGIETLKGIRAEEVIFLVGEKEKWCLKETKRVAKTLTCKWRVIVIPGADHEIAGNYKKELLKIIQVLNVG